MAEPTTPTLAWKLEEWGIEMMQEHSALAGLSIVHHTEDAPAEVSRIVAHATRGEQDDAGLEPWNVALEIRLFLLERDAGLADDYARAISDTFSEFPTVAALANFTYLQYLNAEEEEREDNRNTRQRAKTFNFHAIEAEAATDGVIYAGDEGTMAGSDDAMAGSGEDEDEEEDAMAGSESVLAGSESVMAGSGADEATEPTLAGSESILSGSESVQAGEDTP